MRRVLPLLAAALVALVLPVTVPGSATADLARCSGFQATREAHAADAVFHARVSGRPHTAPGGTLIYPAQVQVPFDGSARGTIHVRVEDGPCQRRHLRVGDDYIFFVSHEQGRWIAAGDRPTVRPYSEGLRATLHRLFDADGEDEVNQQVAFGTPQVGSPRPFARVAAPGAALFLVGVLGLLFVRRLARR